MQRHFATYRRRQSPAKSNAQLFARAAGDLFLPAMQFMFDHIHFGGPPKGDESNAENVLHTLQLTVNQSMSRHFRSADQLSAQFRRFNLLAHQYGLDGCIVTKSTFQG